MNNNTLIGLFLWEWVEKRNPWKQEQVFVLLLYKYRHVRTIKLSIFNLTPHVCHATPSKERSPTQSPSYLQHQLHHSHQTTHPPPLSLLKSPNNQAHPCLYSPGTPSIEQWRGAGMALHEWGAAERKNSKLQVGLVQSLFPCSSNQRGHFKMHQNPTQLSYLDNSLE